MVSVQLNSVAGRGYGGRIGYGLLRCRSGCGGFPERGIWDRGAPVAIAVHALDGGKRAVVLALGLLHVPTMRTETDLLLLDEGFSDPCIGTAVMAGHVIPEFLVGSAGALPGPGGIGKLLDEHSLMAVTGLVCRGQTREEVAVVLFAFVR